MTMRNRVLLHCFVAACGGNGHHPRRGKDKAERKKTGKFVILSIAHMFCSPTLQLLTLSLFRSTPGVRFREERCSCHLHARPYFFPTDSKQLPVGLHQRNPAHTRTRGCYCFVVHPITGFRRVQKGEATEQPRFANTKVSSQ